MTEKRFTLSDDVGMLDVACGNIFDNGEFVGTVQLCDGDNIVTLLNEQHETITKLKSELLLKEDLIQQLKNILEEDYYKKWKKTNLNYIRVCEELAEENRAYEKLSDENEQLKQTIQEAYENERTALGKSVLKQLLEKIE